MINFTLEGPHLRQVSRRMDYALLAVVEALATSTLEPSALDVIMVRFFEGQVSYAGCYGYRRKLPSMAALCSFTSQLVVVVGKSRR